MDNPFIPLKRFSPLFCPHDAVQPQNDADIRTYMEVYELDVHPASGRPALRLIYAAFNV